ncbi:MAG: hypothetical protein ABIO70_24765 [Pseudomonadota bacterium]
MPPLAPSLLLLCACHAPPRDTQAPGDSDPWLPPDPSTYRTSLPTAPDLAALVDTAHDVKYTAPIDGREREAPLLQDAYLQDMRAWPWHLPFLSAFPELRELDMPTYEAWVIANDTRRWWGGSLRFLPGTPHPASGVMGALAFSFYADASAGGTTTAHVQEVWDRVNAVAPWAADLLVWYPDGSPQAAAAEAIATDLAAAGIPWLPITSLVEPLPAEDLVQGEADAVLRLDHAADGEILVAAAVPDPLPAVAALLITEGDPSLATLDIPIAVLNARDNAVIRALDGAYVHVAVSAGRLDLYPLHPEDP